MREFAASKRGTLSERCGSMDELIVLKGISKSYEGKRVLDGIDLVIKENQSVALTGCNGSGKSTLLKMIAGLVKPSGGRVITRRRLLFHYIPEQFPGMNFTALQYLRRLCEIDGGDWEKEQGKILGLCEDFFIRDMLHTRMKHLSKGTLQKVGVVQALMTRPDVLLLDEPLSGQDMESQEVFVRKINEMRRDNVTILMACHERRLIGQVSDTVYCIREGRLRPRTAEEKSDGDAGNDPAASGPGEDGLCER